VGAPDDAGSFRAQSELPEQVAKLNLGVDMFASEQIHRELEHAGEADDYQSHTRTLRFTYLFE
jgi:hypothetical protein